MIVCLQELVLGRSFAESDPIYRSSDDQIVSKLAFSMQSCCRWDRIHPITGIVSPVKSWDPQISRLPGANPSENRLVAVSDTQKTQIGDSGVFQVFWNFANQRFPTIRLKNLEEFKACCRTPAEAGPGHKSFQISADIRLKTTLWRDRTK